MKRLRKCTALVLAMIMILAMFTNVFAAENTQFSDVAQGAWYADAVNYASSNNLMSGTSNTDFSPSGTMTRAMLATVLYRIAGNPAVSGSDDFTDTADGQWYTSAVIWASQNKYIDGYGNGIFGTNDSVSREQIAAILYRYSGSPEAAQAGAFSDAADIASWAAAAVNWAKANGVLSGRGNNRFEPKAGVTRAEVATILMNYMTMDSDNNDENNNGSNANNTGNTDTAAKDVLVVYFSQPETTNPNNMTEEEANSTVVINGEVLGNTQYMAYVIQETADADIFRIEPSVPYPTDHSALVPLAREEQDNNVRPAIKDSIDNLSQYDTVFVGYPNWWGDMPMILYTFFETYDFSGKTVVPFNTHGGCGFSGTISAIRELEPNATVLNGLSISRNHIQDARQEIVDRVNDLDIK